MGNGHQSMVGGVSPGTDGWWLVEATGQGGQW